MKNRVRLDNGKSSTLKCPSDYAPSSFADFLADLQEGVVYVDVTPNNDLDDEPGVTEIGTALNKDNLLSDTVAQGFGFDATDDVTVNDVLNRIGNDYLEGTLTAGQTQTVITDSRITTNSIIDPYYQTLADGTVVVPEKTVVANGSITFVFIRAYTQNIRIKVRVM